METVHAAPIDLHERQPNPSAPALVRHGLVGSDETVAGAGLARRARMAETKKLVLNKAKHQKVMDAVGKAGKSLKALAKQADQLSKDYESIEKAKSK